MEPRAFDKETTNTTSAIIFITYILAGLFLTGLISCDLINTYIFLPQSLRVRDGLQKQIQIFISLAVLSFSVLCYHLTDFLIESYQEWAIDRDIELPYRLYGKMGLLGPSPQRTQIYIWTWLQTSSLFQDFTQAVFQSYESYWWTLQALLMTMAWSVFLSQEGMPLILKNHDHTVD